VQLAVRTWARALMCKGWMCWAMTTKMQGTEHLVGKLREVEQDNIRIKKQWSMAGGRHEKAQGLAMRSMMMEAFFTAAKDGAQRKCIFNWRDKCMKVMAANKVGGDQRMSAMMTMGSVLSSWKGRNARGKRTLAGFTRLIMYTALPDLTSTFTYFAKWQVRAIKLKTERMQSEALGRVDAAAKAKTAQLGMKLEMMVRQAAGVERILAMIRVSDANKVAKFMGSWKVYMEERYTEKIQENNKRGFSKGDEVRKKAAASQMGRIFLNGLKGSLKKFFYEWTQVKEDRKVESFSKGVEKVRTLLLGWRGAGKLEFMSRWRERTRVSRACQQVAAVRRVDAVFSHNTQVKAMSSVSAWREKQTTSKARRLRDDDIGKVAWRYQRFGHHLVGAQATSGFLDKLKVLKLAPAMTKWKERSFFHVVPPHRYSYQSFGRQMVGAQQISNILDRKRILAMIWALSAWNEVVFTKNTAAGGTFIVSPNRFVVGQSPGGMSGNLTGVRNQMNSMGSGGTVDLSYAQQVAQPHPPPGNLGQDPLGVFDGGSPGGQDDYMNQPLGGSGYSPYGASTQPYQVADDFSVGGSPYGGQDSGFGYDQNIDQVVNPEDYQLFG